MARRALIVDYCDRCPKAKPAKAVATLVVESQGDRYKLMLCEQHKTEYDRQVFAWARLGQLLEPEHRFSESAKADARRLSHLRVAQAETPAAAPPPKKAMRLTGDALRGMPHEAGDWVFTEHAIQRLRERNISAVQALRAATMPSTVRESATDPGAQIHVRDGIKAVVLDDDMVILTVAKEDQVSWSESTRKAQ